MVDGRGVVRRARTQRGPPKTPEHVEPVRTRSRAIISSEDSDSDSPYTNEERVKELEEAQKDVPRRLTRLAAAAIESKVDEGKQPMARSNAEASERTERALKRAMKKEREKEKEIADGKKPQQREESSQSGSKRSASAKYYR